MKAGIFHIKFVHSGPVKLQCSICPKHDTMSLTEITYLIYFHFVFGAPEAQWVKRWPTDLADRVRSSLEVKSSQP